ncbi:MAG: helicase-exonuclease AddAB subunit AddA [Roseburia sp.]
MSVSWTEEQRQVIDLRKRNILVSAAAGSGKTAVLVERIIGLVTDREHPVDIDRLLIVTFTNAAAAEMRERIGNAIEKELEKNPMDAHLQRQLTLIHNAQITTIDSFCLYVIRNHFHEIDLEPSFRIGDEGELKLLREDVLEKVLRRNYAQGEEAFLSLVDGYATGKNDAALRSMILQLYDFSRSYPWPKQWLSGCLAGYGAADEEEFCRADFLKPLTAHIRAVAENLVELSEQAYELTQRPDGPDIYEPAIRSDLEKYRRIASCGSFSELSAAFCGMSYDRLASSRGFSGSTELLEQVKTLREQGKDAVKKICRQYFFGPPSAMLAQMKTAGGMAEELVRLVLEFGDAFDAQKRRKNLVDFYDLEHFALEILVDEETGLPKKTAEEFQKNFAEIMIDEYQDSNYVQETLLRAVSREWQGENNIFMVGDVKQSIYRFRLARPELFMEKYRDYSVEESDRQRIDLHKNFRSRNEVLACTNDIFHKIMKQDLGNVEYDAAAALYPGAVYPDSREENAAGSSERDGADPMFTAEIYLAEESDELLEDTDYPDKKLLEAKLLATQIKRLMREQKVTDKTTGELRKLRFSDIVILLRSLSGWADAFASVLNDSGIPAHTLSATGYFSATEVQTVLALLRILDNPRQDIPLAAVLKSPIAGFSNEELALLRLYDRAESFHGCVLARCRELYDAKAQGMDGDWGTLEQKLYAFYELYLKLRQLVPDTPIHELIILLLKETGYGDYAAAMPAGDRRRANLEMLVEKAIAYEKTSYKGLFHFVRYIDELQKYDVDFGEADMVSENEDVVRIMSIHKSKGLEFPVVFVCGLGKQFNRQDVRSRMVLHPELGVGLDALDGKRRTKCPTMIKKAIAKQIDLENLGEELRVLYVALTRAREKLILTGGTKDAQKLLEQAELAASLRKKDAPLSYLDRADAACYLDWVLPALLSYGDKYRIHVVSAASLVEEELAGRMEEKLGQAECLQQIAETPEELVEQLDRRFGMVYPYASDIERKNKYSVSELKHRAMREAFEQEDGESVPLFATEEVVPYVPGFARRREMQQEREEENRGALRGTAVHRVMECYRFAAEEAVREQVDGMLEKDLITPEMKELVKLPLVEHFVASELGLRMRAAEKAGRLYREKPFVMGFTEQELCRFGFGEGEQKLSKAEVLQENAGSDLTLIQGIIDVFWIEEDGIVLLDYKTDRVENEKQLADRYRAQLALYAEALERVYNRGAKQMLKVKERLLYSFRLEKVISV